MNWKKSICLNLTLFNIANDMKIGIGYPAPISKEKKFLSNTALPAYGKAREGEGVLMKKRFFNQCFDKGRLKNFVLWFFLNYGENKTVHLVEQLKNVGFYYASKAGISLGIDDLKIPPKKNELIYEAETLTNQIVKKYARGEITGVERFQNLIGIWHRTSEYLKQEVINHFEATDILNPVYMMAFSGARGNISQVRQLVGMRGLMSDPQGQILEFPIRSNFREGLTLTEYIISSYGARKGIVDTALRTANAGYLTRRLVDVAQHVIISSLDCGTKRGIFLTNMKEGKKTIYSLSQRTVGRILARDLFRTVVTSTENMETSNTEQLSNKAKAKKNEKKIASRNEEITIDLAFELGKTFDKVFVRSPLTCETSKQICQLCYGWSLAQGNLVSIGEAVGVVAAQSIGEPGTQLTMRTFHTGGVFAGDVSDQIKAPFDGIIEYLSAIPGTLIRTPDGKIAFLTKGEGSFLIHKNVETPCLALQKEVYNANTRKYKIPYLTLLYMKNGEKVLEKQVVAQITSISQKTNATDEASFVIKSEYEGQFYAKLLSFHEKEIGPKLPSFERFTMNQEKDTKDILYTKKTEFGQIEKTQQNLETVDCFAEMEKIYESWTWGFAWILSGKIYELKKTTSFFPKLGDFLNTKSTIDRIQWNVNSAIPRTFGETLGGNQIKLDFKKRTPSGSFDKKHVQKDPLQRSLQSREQAIPIGQSNSPILFLDLTKIIYKKIGYVFQPTEKFQFLRSTAHSSSFTQNTMGEKVEKRFDERRKGVLFMENPNKDLIFFFKGCEASLKNFNQIKSIHNPSPNLLSEGYREANKKWPFLLEWFPIKNQTASSGYVIIEKFDTLLHNNLQPEVQKLLPKGQKQQRTKNQKLMVFKRTHSTLDISLAKKNVSNLKDKLINKSRRILDSSAFLPYSKAISKSSKASFQRILWVPSLFFNVKNTLLPSPVFNFGSWSPNTTSTINSKVNYNFYNKKLPIFLQINLQGNVNGFQSKGLRSFKENSNDASQTSAITFAASQSRRGTSSKLKLSLLDPVDFGKRDKLKRSFTVDSQSTLHSPKMSAAQKAWNMTSAKKCSEFSLHKKSTFKRTEGVPSERLALPKAGRQTGKKWLGLRSINSNLPKGLRSNKTSTQYQTKLTSHNYNSSQNIDPTNSFGGNEKYLKIKVSNFLTLNDLPFKKENFDPVLSYNRRGVFLKVDFDKKITNSTGHKVEKRKIKESKRLESFNKLKFEHLSTYCKNFSSPFGLDYNHKENKEYNLDLSNYLEKEYIQYKKILNKEKFFTFMHSRFVNLTPCLDIQTNSSMPFEGHKTGLCSYVPFALQSKALSGNAGYPLKVRKSVFTGVLKKGWVVAFTQEPTTSILKNSTTSFFSAKQKEAERKKQKTWNFHKKVIYPGHSIMGNMIFNKPVLTECILLSSKEKSQVPSIKRNHNFDSIAQLPLPKSFNWINNPNSRFFMDTIPTRKDKNESLTQWKEESPSTKSIGLLIQPIEEYTKMSNIEFKKYIYEYNTHNNHIKQLKRSYRRMLRRYERNVYKLVQEGQKPIVNQSFDSITNRQKYKMNLFNKQKKTSQPSYQLIQYLKGVSTANNDFTVISNNVSDQYFNFIHDSYSSTQSLTGIGARNTTINNIVGASTQTQTGFGSVLIQKRLLINAYEEKGIKKAINLGKNVVSVVSRKPLNLSPFFISFNLFTKANYDMASLSAVLSKGAYLPSARRSEGSKKQNKQALKKEMPSENQRQALTITKNTMLRIRRRDSLKNPLQLPEEKGQMSKSHLVSSYFFDMTSSSRKNKKMLPAFGFPKEASSKEKRMIISKNDKAFDLTSLVQRIYKEAAVLAEESMLRKLNKGKASSTSTKVSLATTRNSATMSSRKEGYIDRKYNFSLFYPTYMISYTPISKLDSFLFPSLSTHLNSLFNFYLNLCQRTPWPTYKASKKFASKEEATKLQVTLGKNSYTRESVGSSIYSSKRVPQKTGQKNGLEVSMISNVFESPCFSLNLVYPINTNSLADNKKNNKKTKYYYSASLPIAYSSEIGANSSSSVLTSRGRVRNGVGEKLRSFAYRDQQRPKIFAQTNLMSPFVGEIVSIQRGITTNFGKTNNMLFTSFAQPNKGQSEEELPISAINASCLFLTKKDFISFYLPTQTFVNSSSQLYRDEKVIKSKLNVDKEKKQTFGSLEQDSKYMKNMNQYYNLLKKQNYEINNIFMKFYNASQTSTDDITKQSGTQEAEGLFVENAYFKISKLNVGVPTFTMLKSNIGGVSLTALNTKRNQIVVSPTIDKEDERDFNNNSYPSSHSLQIGNHFDSISKTVSKEGKEDYNSLPLLGDFFMSGDPLDATTTLPISGQIIHYNNKKITLRRGQPILISPKSIIHKLDGEFIVPKTPAITLTYQKLKTGDIVQGIPKVEQFFEARTTKRGRLFRESLPSLLKALFNRYQSKLTFELAVRQSFYKIQQILVDGVLRVYKSQGVTISDKHLEVIVKQMTSKVRIIDGAQTGFFPGEIVDLYFVEKINRFLIKKITYEPLVLGITRASLEVDSFLSASSFQQTTRVLSQAAIYRKKDFLKGLKENVILGNLIPAGTGYFVSQESN